MKSILPFFILLGSLFAATANAQVLDQQQTQASTTNNYNSYEYIGQTFTPGIGGPLSKITLKLHDASSGSHTATLKIYPADGAGLPVTAILLASSTRTVSTSSETDYDFIFSTPYAVTAGTKYAMVISSSAGGNGRFSYHNSDNYSSGTFFYKIGGSGIAVPGSDLYFKTYVGAIPLPLQWLSVSGTQNSAGSNTLQWKVAEYAVAAYEVEHSRDALNYRPIARIESKGDGINEYQYTHTGANTGYYRIKQTDHDGRYAYSSVIAIRGRAAGEPVQVYPTVTAGLTMVQAPERLAGTQAVLCNMQGATLAVYPVTAGSFTINMAGYASGSYILLFSDGSVARMQRL